MKSNSPRRPHRCPSLAFVLALCAAVAHSPAHTAETAHTGDVADVRTVRHMDKHPGSSELWEPYLAQWRGRHLVAAFGVKVPGKTDMGDIMASVSTDDGDTWGDPVFVFNHLERQGTIQFAYANAILFKPPGQDVLWAFAMRCPMNYRHSEDSQLVGAYSADGGRSWIPVELSMGYTGPLICVAGPYALTEKGQTRYLFPMHRNTRRNDPLGSRDHFVLSSTSLMEWNLAAFVPQSVTGPKVFLHEGNIAPGDAPGELKMVMRTADYENESKMTDPPRAFSTVSSDGGRTWSAAKQEPDLWNAKSKAFFGRTTGGTHLYVYNDGPATPAPGGRTSLRYKLKPAGGAWSAEKTFYDAGISELLPDAHRGGTGGFSRGLGQRHQGPLPHPHPLRKIPLVRHPVIQQPSALRAMPLHLTQFYVRAVAILSVLAVPFVSPLLHAAPGAIEQHDVFVSGQDRPPHSPTPVPVLTVSGAAGAKANS